MSISFIMPTRNRHEVLAETLKRVGLLSTAEMKGCCELLIVDNASETPVEAPAQLENGIPVELLRLDFNANTAARNIAAIEAEGDWLVMLDDDSSPLVESNWRILDQIDEDIGAVGGEIILPAGNHEAGGLPEVFVGCGCAIRKSVFLELSGYDASFGYYAEEYEFCAELIQSGYRVAHSRSIRFLHRKSAVARDFNEIIRRLVRNNAWVMQRYAPDTVLREEMDSLLDRYHTIARKENAMEGYKRGREEIEKTLNEQIRTPLHPELWDRFTGRAAARKALRAAFASRPVPVRVVGSAQAKGRGIIESELAELGCDIVDHGAESIVIGTLSPGPILDLLAEFPDAVVPWAFEEPVPTHP